MKIKVLALAALVCLLPSCGVTSGGSQNVSEEDAALVAAARQNHELTIEVDRIIPVGMPSRTTFDGYKLSIKDGKVTADLPFFGTSHTAMIYGVDATGIVFEDCPIEIIENNSKADRGRYIWDFTAKCNNERVEVQITFWDNGSAQISCVCTNRSNMSYSGRLIKKD